MFRLNLFLTLRFLPYFLNILAADSIPYLWTSVKTQDLRIKDKMSQRSDLLITQV